MKRYIGLFFLLILVVSTVAIIKKTQLPTVGRDVISDNQLVFHDELSPMKANRVVREYPSRGITINATYNDSGARVVPCLSVCTSQTYYDDMVRNFLLERFPDAQQEETNTWIAAGSTGDTLVYMNLSDTNRLYFCDTKLDVPGKVLDLDQIEKRYLYFTDIEMKNIDKNSYSLDVAIEDTIQTLKSYTDFELFPYKAYIEKDDKTEKSWYRIGFQLSYQGIPCCLYSIPGLTGLDVGISQDGIGYMQGVFNFERINETEIQHTMSLGDILNSFENQIQLMQFPNMLEIYHIQLEYWGELGDSPDEFLFRPVWTFYGIADDVFPYSLKLYADTGSFCCQGV